MSFCLVVPGDSFQCDISWTKLFNIFSIEVCGILNKQETVFQRLVCSFIVSYSPFTSLHAQVITIVVRKFRFVQRRHRFAEGFLSCFARGNSQYVASRVTKMTCDNLNNHRPAGWLSLTACAGIFFSGEPPFFQTNIAFF